MKLILLGAPGAGKGTQAEVICKHLGIPAVSTGNCLREAVKNGTDMGKKAQSFMEGGQLVPDDVVIGIIRERLAQEDCRNGFILDGFPRTVPQAQALDEMGVTIDRVINLEVADDAIEQRLTGRRVCSSCGASYHMAFKAPAKAGVCDACGGELVVRKDDKPETVRDRLAVYHQQTEPLIGYYQKAGKLYTVEGQEDVADTTALTLKALEAR